LIVERLPLAPPAYAPLWDAYQDRGIEIMLRYKLGSMQPGIPTWFIARCHRFTLGRGDQDGIHWRNGVLFEDKQAHHRALITANAHDRIVEIRVRGYSPEFFMSVLRDGFEDTLQRYAGLDVERWIPCPGTDKRRNRRCSAEFDLSILEDILNDETETDKTMQCYACRSNYNIRDLLLGVGSTELTEQVTVPQMRKLFDEYHEGTRNHVSNAHLALKQHLDLRFNGLLKYLQRNFLRLFKQQQSNELITCPNLFTIRQVVHNGVMVKNKWHIQLYCQEPGQPHPIGEPYILNEQRKIIGKVLPYLKAMLKMLQFVAPMASAALAVSSVAGDKNFTARTWASHLDNEVKLMGEFVAATEVLANVSPDNDGAIMRSHPKRGEFTRIPAADLTPVRQLMDILAQQDVEAGRPKWYGLRRAFTPEGDILWLDDEHLKTYLSQRPRPKAPTL
ncbi:MAG: hypothetical protein ACPG8W_25110, partial [Candidatus Promineifilaceae bacterium]